MLQTGSRQLLGSISKARWITFVLLWSNHCRLLKCEFEASDWPEIFITGYTILPRVDSRQCIILSLATILEVKIRPYTCTWCLCVSLFFEWYPSKAITYFILVLRASSSSLWSSSPEVDTLDSSTTGMGPVSIAHRGWREVRAAGGSVSRGEVVESAQWWWVRMGADWWATGEARVSKAARGHVCCGLTST